MPRLPGGVGLRRDLTSTTSNLFDERIVGIEETRIADITEIAAIFTIDAFTEILPYHPTPTGIRSRVENHLVKLILLVLDILLPAYLVLGDVIKQFAPMIQLNQHRILCTGISYIPITLQVGQLLYQFIWR